MSGPRPVACLTVSPTFSTTLDDLRREDPSAPMITDRESALFASYQVSSTDTDIDMPSPLSDSDLAQIINIEGASWAVDLRGVSYRSRLSSPRTSPPQVVDPSAPVLQNFDLILGVPPIYHKLTDAGAPFWASVVLDLRKLLWAHMSQKLSGREPTKSLFIELNGKAVTRQASTWDPVRVNLDIPRIALVETSREHMIEGAFQIRELLHIVKEDVSTSPGDIKFMLAIMLAFTAEWVRYRTHCYRKAAIVVLPHAVRDYSGLLPQPENFTPTFRSKLKTLINDHAWGWALLHEHPTAVLPLSSSSPSEHRFLWFGNHVLREVVHRALYDPTYPGWFGFLDDVTKSDGRRTWAPISSASARQVAQVLGWIEEVLNFHIVQADKASGPFTTYAQVPDHSGVSDSVIKRTNRHVKFLAALGGETPEPDSPFSRIEAIPKEMPVCLSAYDEFIKRPAYLPYALNP